MKHILLISIEHLKEGKSILLPGVFLGQNCVRIWMLPLAIYFIQKFVLSKAV